MDHETIYQPSFVTPAKPKRGAPCNGCGWCCHEEICMIGKVFLELVDSDGMIPHFVKGPCPVMAFEDGKIRCGVVLAEQRSGLKPVAAESLGIGKGCCSDDPHSYESNDSNVGKA